MFELCDMRKCCECENAKLKETFYDKEGNAHPCWFCGKHRLFITEFTLVLIGCKGKDFKQRGN